MGVGIENGGKRVGCEVIDLTESVFDDARNRKERDAGVEEGGDGDLVGRVEDGGCDAAGGHRLAGEAEAGKTKLVDGAEFEAEELGEIESGFDAGRAMRVEQRVLDGKRHRRRAELGEHGAVGELDEAMDDALRVEDRGALLGAEIEEPLGFDEFEAFVGERGGVDGDFRAHRPVGVLEGVGGRDVREAFLRPIAESAAGGGEDDAADAGLRVALEALEDGVVLGVDGEEFDVVLARGGHDELAGEDEDFLGSEREVFAGGDRGERGFEAGGADDRDEDDVGLGERREFDEAGEAAVEFRAGRERAGVGRGFRGGVGAIVKDGDVRDLEVAGDLRESLVVLAGGDADELKFVAVGGDDAERVFADGAGGAEEDEAFGGGIWNRRSRNRSLSLSFSVGGGERTKNEKENENDFFRPGRRGSSLTER